MSKERINESDILVAAQEIYGVPRLDQIDHVIPEIPGFSIIPQCGNDGREEAAHYD
jgi:hypothetical protein